MADILLSSEKFIKETTSISDNIAGKYILPSLREAQETGLKSILGDALLSKLKTLVKAGTIDDESNADYKTLLDRCQYYLAYRTITEITTKVAYKIGNSGVQKTSDENMSPATQDEISKMEYYYQSKADNYCLDLQYFLLENRTSYAELTENVIYKIESNLHSAASCGIFLGGKRGKGSAPKAYRRERR